MYTTYTEKERSKNILGTHNREAHFVFLLHRKETSDGFQTRILFISFSSTFTSPSKKGGKCAFTEMESSCLKHLYIVHLVMPRTKTFFSSLFVFFFLLSFRPLKCGILTWSICQPQVPTLPSPLESDKSLLVFRPRARAMPLCTLCSSLNGIFITYLASLTFCFSIASSLKTHRRQIRRKKAKLWTLQLMYDNYIYFFSALSEEPTTTKSRRFDGGKRRKGANFRKIRRKFLFFYFSCCF